MKKNLKGHVLSLIFAFLTLAVCVIIFLFSHQPAAESSKTSSDVLTFIATLFNKDFPLLPWEEQKEILISYMFFIRKAAHFSIFAALGFFSNLALRSFYSENKAPLPRLSFVYNAAFCLFYAATDEFHQLFIEGRSGNITDVLIDFSGSVTALVIIALFVLIFGKIKAKNKKKQISSK